MDRYFKISIESWHISRKLSNNVLAEVYTVYTNIYAHAHTCSHVFNCMHPCKSLVIWHVCKLCIRIHEHNVCRAISVNDITWHHICINNAVRERLSRSHILPNIRLLPIYCFWKESGTYCWWIYGGIVQWVRIMIEVPWSLVTRKT